MSEKLSDKNLEPQDFPRENSVEEDELSPPAKKAANVLMVLTIIAVGIDIIARIITKNAPTVGIWTISLISVLLPALLIAIIARRIYLENALGAGIVILAICLMWICMYSKFSNLLSGIEYTKTIGLVFNLFPFFLPLLITGMLLSAREAARTILRPWRRSSNYGIAVLILAILLFALAHLGFETFAVKGLGLWIYAQEQSSTSGLLHIPMQVHIAWTIFAILTLAIGTAWLVKRRVWIEPPHWQPAAQYLLVILWLAINNLLTAQFVIGIIMLGVGGLVVIGSSYGIKIARERFMAKYTESEASV